MIVRFVELFGWYNERHAGEPGSLPEAVDLGTS